MNSTCKTAVAAAVAGGYVLGRTRKAKMAFAIGTFLAGRRFGLTPTALAAEGLRQLRGLPQLADLREQISGELLDAARAAAATTADRRFSAFADTLRDRVREDWTADEGDEADEAEEKEEGDEAEEEEAEEEEPSAGEQGSGGERRKAPARKKAPGRKPPAKKTAAKKTAPAKKTAQAGKKSGPAKKTSSGRSSRSTNHRGER